MSTSRGVHHTPEERRFLAHTFTDSRGHILPYRILEPTVRPRRTMTGTPDVNPGKMPLVLLLHGSGERGTDNCAQLGNGVAGLLGSKMARAQFPCYYLVPQCATEYRWVEADWDAEHHVLPGKLSVPLSATIELVELLLDHYPVDRHRLYLIGLSMGGFGVWDLLSRWPERFAAAVPICGGADVHTVAAARDTPIWAFHGAQDPNVRVERSRSAVAALRAAGGSPRYTEYPDAGHEVWTDAFAEPKLLLWLFAQRT